jgi:nucleoside-diphosphate-sugar epimerase
MRAAARGQDYHISFGGKTQMHFASDVAQQFIAAAEQPLDGAFAFNLGTTPASMGEVAALIMTYVPNVRITHGETPLPFAEGTDGSALYRAFPAHIYKTPLAEGIRQTLEAFARLG